MLDKGKLKIEGLRWLSERSMHWNVCAAFHVPNGMRRHYYGYSADWLAKEMTRYLNKVDRHIYNAAHRNRGVRLQRIITLEHDDSVGWHAHGVFDCPEGWNEDETIRVLRHYWQAHTKRFATEKFEKRIDYFEYDSGRYLRYILKRLDWQDEGATGMLDTRNTYLFNS